MCLVGIAIDHFADFPLVIVANRDEFHARPTQVLHRWTDPPGVIAGRDLQAGGSWLGATDKGRLAVLTNIRGHTEPPANAPSRGALVTDFLISNLSAEQWLEQLQSRVTDYAGFNLIVSDNARDIYLTNSYGDIQPLVGGVHALSNGRYDEHWPKTDNLRLALAQCLDPASAGSLLKTIESRYQPPDADLPQTGIGLDQERLLAPALIISEDYGTRATTILQLNSNGKMTITEYTRLTDGNVCHEVHESWLLAKFGSTAR